MQITHDELRARGFLHAGTVRPDPANILRLDVHADFYGFVVYLLVVNGEVKKAGITTTRLSWRMSGTFNALKNKMRRPADHPNHQEQTFQQHAPATIRAGHAIEIWAKSEPSRDAAMAEETGLNLRYKGEWTKEGKQTRATAGLPSLLLEPFGRFHKEQVLRVRGSAFSDQS